MTDDQTFEGEPEALPVLPSSIRDAVLSELRGLETFVDGVSVADLQKRSAVGAWSNLEVVAHLQLALSLYTRLLSAGTSGWTGGALGRAMGSVTKSLIPAAAPAINAVNSLLPRVLTGTLSPEGVKGQLVGSSRALRAQLETLESGDYTKPIYYRGGPWPLSFFLGAMLNELAIHRWDVESTLVGDAHLSDAARSVLPWFYWSGTSFMFQPPAGTTGTVALALSDPSIEMSWVIADRGATTVHRGSELKADATIRGKTGVAVLALAGRIPADAALTSTSLTVDGDEILARRFLGAWRIV
jgi:DinB family protein/SCP-2 sterol transfer family protein